MSGIHSILVTCLVISFSCTDPSSSQLIPDKFSEPYDNRPLNMADDNLENVGKSLPTTGQERAKSAFDEEARQEIKKELFTFAGNQDNSEEVPPKLKMARFVLKREKLAVDEDTMAEILQAKMHPYSVRLVTEFRKSGNTVIKESLHCIGTLIANIWVLTAARCVRKPDRDTVKVTVIAGANLTDASAALGEVQVLSTFEWNVHPDYALSSIGLPDFDVALVRLPEPFKSNDFVRPANLFNEAWKRGRYARCTVTSFKSDDVAKTRTGFNTFNLEAGKPCMCEPFLRANHGSAPTARLMCVRYGSTPERNGSNLCSVDLGGGLVCDGKLSGVFGFSASLAAVMERDTCTKEVRIPVDPSEAIAPLLECGGKNSLIAFQDTHQVLDWVKTTAGIVVEKEIDLKTNSAVSVNIRSILILFPLFVAF